MSVYPDNERVMYGNIHPGGKVSNDRASLIQRSSVSVKGNGHRTPSKGRAHCSVRKSRQLARQVKRAVSEQREFQPPTSLLQLVEALVSGHHVAPGDLCTQRGHIGVRMMYHGCYNSGMSLS